MPLITVTKQYCTYNVDLKKLKFSYLSFKGDFEGVNSDKNTITHNKLIQSTKTSSNPAWDVL